MNRLKEKTLTSSISYQSFTITFCFFFAILIALNNQFFYMPPVWDTTAGVFSPAIYLYENQFDFAGLLKTGGYISGGPNNHSFSLITFLTYFIIAISNGNPDFFLPLLHIIHFAFAGITLSYTYFIAQRIFGNYVAIALTFSLLFFPLFLVQTGYLYTEILGGTLVVAAIFSWATRNYFCATILAIVACIVKSFGIAIIAVLAILFLFDTSLSYKNKLCRIVGLILPVILFEAIKLQFVYPSDISDNHYLLSILGYLYFVPDLLLIVLVNLLFPFLFLGINRVFTPKALIQQFNKYLQGDESQRLLVASFLFSAAFLGFIFTVPLSGKPFVPLIRYYVWGLPTMLICVCYVIKMGIGHLMKSHTEGPTIEISLTIIFISLTLFFIANNKGRYYPPLGHATNDFSVVERSYEYLDFFKNQYNSVNSLTELQNNRTAFVTRGSYYLLYGPLMGYINEKQENTFFVLNPPYNSLHLKDLPDEFILLDSPSNIFQGAGKIKKILERAKSNSDYSVSELVIHQTGPYKSSIYLILRTLNYDLAR